MVLLISWAFAPTGSAQTQSSYLVVRAPRVPKSLQRQIEDVLESQGEVVSDTDYVRAAGRMGLSAHESRAIVALLPGLGVGLVVTVETTTRNAGRYLRLSYRSPETGDEVVRDELPYRGGPLPSSYRKWIQSQARLALSTLSARRGYTDNANVPEFGDDASSPDPNRPNTPTDTQASTVNVDGVDATDPDAPLPPRTLQMDGVVGLGLGQRAVDLPTQSGTRVLNVGPFFVVDGAVRTRLHLSEAFQLALALRYTTSVALTAESTPAAGIAQAVPLRSHRMELMFGSLMRLSTGETTPWLGFQVGYAMQDLRGLIEVTMPRFTLSGPLARVDLRAVIVEGRVTLWAMPEVQWLVDVDNSLTRLHVSRGGYALGGEVGFSARLNEQFLFEASYREAHAFVSTREPNNFHDLERVFTARLVVQR